MNKVKLNENGYTKYYTDGKRIAIVGGYDTDKEVQEWIANGGVVEPFETAEEVALREAKEATRLAKEAKLLALDTITVTTTNGNTFDGNESARVNMSNAIDASVFLGQTEAYWKLADNSIVLVGLDELKEALALSIQRVGEIVTGTDSV